MLLLSVTLIIPVFAFIYWWYFVSVLVNHGNSPGRKTRYPSWWTRCIFQSHYCATIVAGEAGDEEEIIIQITVITNWTSKTNLTISEKKLWKIKIVLSPLSIVLLLKLRLFICLSVKTTSGTLVDYLLERENADCYSLIFAVSWALYINKSTFCLSGYLPVCLSEQFEK